MEFRPPGLTQIRPLRGDGVQGLPRLSGAAQMGRLMFCCAGTGREFDSGFRGTAEDLHQIPPDYTMNVRCSVCHQVHVFKLSDARISDDPAGS